MALKAIQQISIPAKREKGAFGKIKRQETFVSFKIVGAKGEEVGLIEMTITDDLKILTFRTTNTEGYLSPKAQTSFEKVLYKANELFRGNILVNKLSFEF